jgi:osmoprotectant transport system substrate-binding protein
LSLVNKEYEGVLSQMKLIYKSAAALVVGVLAIAGCGANSDPTAQDTTEQTSKPAAKDTIAVGSANFPESALLAEIYAGALKAKGVEVTTKLNIGSREAYLGGLQDGSIDLVPEYTGNLLQYYDKKATAKTADDVYAALPAAVPDKLIVLDKAPAEDKDAVVVTKEIADKYKLQSIADIKPVQNEIVLGGPPEWRTRANGLPGLKSVYGLTFKSFRPLDVAGPLTVQALKNGQVQAANLFTTQSAIAANNFVVLEDPQNLFLPQNVVPLINKAKASDNVKAALNGVSAKLDTPKLAELVKEVEVDKKEPAAVADAWLTESGLK